MAEPVTREPDSREPGRCELRLDKWDGTTSKTIPLLTLDTDRFGRWYRWPAGHVMTRRSGPPQRPRRDQLLLVPRTGSWIARWALDGEFALYCDVTTPVLTTATGGLWAVDLDLDVVRYRDRRVALIDQDQFESRRVSMGYPPEVVEQAWTTADWLHRAVSDGHEPFATVGPGRLTPLPAAALAAVNARLLDRHGADDDPARAAVIRRLVARTAERFRDATITEFLPVLVERAVGAALAAHPNRVL
ncbi:DUF402 domain-containing protein [Actinomycetospora endophytica]|uniref:DUF402 domain-containing protein n=1 Tax=Actinomycetospora endophytica TaxID=2291215 RepID=A0ABS8P4B3_9PSEU|nr:DUF402 domain-containing protein [Actinomycetospora endophytica]MCD2193088.1 DUF402 domain-containing protein [Actinomycetospora endophytica]